MTEKARVVFLDRATVSRETVFRPLGFAHEIESFQTTSSEEVAGRIREADIVICNKVALDRATLEGARRLKLIAVAATGHDPIDTEACRELGITVSNVRGYARDTVPEHTFALMLALRRSILPYRASVIAGRWQESGQFCYFDYPIADLAGATLGVIGDGTLGRAVAKLGEAFGMRVLFAAHKGREGMGSLYTPFEEVLRASDVLTLHCPLTERSRNMIGRREFELMQRRPVIVNTARGGLVDEDLIGWALDEGHISGIGFDVISEEPPGRDHPLMRLAGRENVIITPHVAWASQQAMQAMADQLMDNIEAFWRGEPKNVVV